MGVWLGFKKEAHTQRGTVSGQTNKGGRYYHREEEEEII